MPIDKNKIIQLFPNKTDKEHAVCKCRGNGKGASGNTLIKQTIELKITSEFLSKY